LSADGGVHSNPLVVAEQSDDLVGRLSAQTIAARNRLPKTPKAIPQRTIEIPIHR